MVTTVRLGVTAMIELGIILLLVFWPFVVTMVWPYVFGDNGNEKDTE